MKGLKFLVLFLILGNASVFAQTTTTPVKDAEITDCANDPKLLCAQDRIMDQYGNVGTVIEVFANGFARITLDGYPGFFTRGIKTLGKGFRCVAHLCRENRIVDQYGNTGTVVEVFSSGYASIILDGYPGKFSRSFETLGLGVNCKKDYCHCRN